ncbi:AraC family transcriptional regulator [Roseivirga thermotolerans]|uniref:AraC family transcriptional regulator n=1 Tax=Roseivirga thermotolerans TaxID=1758176 RepID=UPI00273DB867|nr:helix-turn-helix domain-containing protein [Roseivirga thermotolerans]
MNYETFSPHPDLEAVVKCYWTLEVPNGSQAPKQRIVPDGCIEMCFILGDDIKRFTSEMAYVLQPRAMVIGQITTPYYVQPTGYVNSFAIRFYPYGFANFIRTPIQELADKDTPLHALFDEVSIGSLEQDIIEATSTNGRIEIVERFLKNRLNESAVVDQIVKSTIDALYKTKGKASIGTILKEEPHKRRNLERNFSRLVGISPKQLGKIIRLQAALQSLLNKKNETLTQIAYESEYYDQAHFIKDFKEFTGINPKEYLNDEQMMLSSLIYSES